MLRADDLRGKLFPAVPVPLSATGEVHAEGQTRLVEDLARQPIGGVAVWAHTGRGLRLSPQQRAEVITAWKRGLAPGQILIAAAGAQPGLRQRGEVLSSARAMAQQAADSGADALLVHPPVAFRGHGDQDTRVLEYHATVAEAGLPLLVFALYEAAGGVSYSLPVLAQLLARPDVLGIKIATLDGVMTFQQLAGLVRENFPEKVIVSGEDRFLGYSFMAGAEAALVGMGCACTSLQCELLSSYRAGDAGRFLALSSLVDDLAQHTFISPMEGYIQRMLWCLVHLGVIPRESAHDPWGPRLGQAEFEEIGQCLTRIGAVP